MNPINSSSQVEHGKQPKPAVEAASLSSSTSRTIEQHEAVEVDDEGKRTNTEHRRGLFAGLKIEARKRKYRHDAARAADSDVKGEEVEKAGQLDGAEDKTRLHRTLGWKGCAFHMGAYAIALGVLSIPRVVAVIGWGTFIILSFVFALLTYYTGWAYWRLQQKFPGVHSLEDCGDLLFGPVGAFIFGWSQLLFSVFLQGNHVLLGATAFNALGWSAGVGGTCAIALNAVFAIISFFFTLPRSYRLFAYLAVISLSSIIIVVIIAMIASAVTGPVNQPPGTSPPSTKAFGSLLDPRPDFLDGVLSVTNLFVSFGASPAYLPLMAEMHSPKRDFPKALGILTAFQLVMYLVVGGVVISNLGQYVTSPSLSSLTPTIQKVSYGIGLGTILIAGCEAGQVAAKQLYVKLRRAKPSLFSTNKKGWIVWTLVNAVTWFFAWVLAELLPFFSSFLSVEASAFWSAFLAAAAVIALFVAIDERRSGESWRSNKLLQVYSISFVVLAVTTFIAVFGMWSASVSIQDSYDKGIVGSPFSCELPSA